MAFNYKDAHYVSDDGLILNSKFFTMGDEDPNGNETITDEQAPVGSWYFRSNKQVYYKNSLGSSGWIRWPQDFDVPFDPTGTSYNPTTQTVRAALLESLLIAEGKPRNSISYWDWNSDPIYLYGIGQTRSNEAPWPIAANAKLREISCTGGIDTATANALFALYLLPAGVVRNPVLGTLPTVVNQGLTYTESDFPHSGTTRVTINLVNNGPSRPLTFSENTLTRVVTIQLATNGSGVVTTTRTQLRDAFRANTTITLIYKITGTGGTILAPASIITTGGSVGEAIGAVFMRSKATGFKAGYNTNIVAGQSLVGRVFDQDIDGFSPTAMVANISYI